MDHPYYDDDVIKEYISSKIAQKGNIIVSLFNRLFPSIYIVININTKSRFTSLIVKIDNMDEIFEIFELCEKLELLQELLTYNFNTKAHKHQILVLKTNMDPITIYSNVNHIYLVNVNKEIINEIQLKTLDIYEFINHPLLQPYRIIHSKPIITFE